MRCANNQFLLLSPVPAHGEDGHLQFLDNSTSLTTYCQSMTRRLSCWLSSSTTTALLSCPQVLAVLSSELAKPLCTRDSREGSTPGRPVLLSPETTVIYRTCVVKVLPQVTKWEDAVRVKPGEKKVISATEVAATSRMLTRLFCCQ